MEHSIPLKMPTNDKATNSRQPILTIITVNFNNNVGLKNTIKNLKKQSFQDYEHIIIDAGSSDGSKETIIAYENERDNHLTYWVSEPDKGIYDGMNKGIKQARGEYLYFLNSGDYLTKNILSQIPFDGTQYIYGNIKLVHAKKGSVIWEYPDTFDTFFLANPNGWISQQACFIHKSLFLQHTYDTDYKIISDWIHVVRCILFEGCSYKHLPLLVAIFDGNGESSNGERTWKERNKWIKENLPSAFFKAFTELETFRKSDFADILSLISQTRKFHKRVKKLILFLYRINSFFSKPKPIIVENENSISKCG